MARKTETFTETVTRKKVIVTCDFCGRAAQYSCALCGRDVCRTHSCFDWREDHGDYAPPRWCNACNKVYEKYKADFENEESRHEATMSELERLFLNEAKENAKKK